MLKNDSKGEDYLDSYPMNDIGKEYQAWSSASADRAIPGMAYNAGWLKATERAGRGIVFVGLIACVVFVVFVGLGFAGGWYAGRAHLADHFEAEVEQAMKDNFEETVRRAIENH